MSAPPRIADARSVSLTASRLPAWRLLALLAAAFVAAGRAGADAGHGDRRPHGRAPRAAAIRARRAAVLPTADRRDRAARRRGRQRLCGAARRGPAHARRGAVQAQRRRRAAGAGRRPGAGCGSCLAAGVAAVARSAALRDAVAGSAQSQRRVGRVGQAAARAHARRRTRGDHRGAAAIVPAQPRQAPGRGADRGLLLPYTVAPHAPAVRTAARVASGRAWWLANDGPRALQQAERAHADDPSAPGRRCSRST